MVVAQVVTLAPWSFPAIAGYCRLCRWMDGGLGQALQKISEACEAVRASFPVNPDSDPPVLQTAILEHLQQASKLISRRVDAEDNANEDRKHSDKHMIKRRGGGVRYLFGALLEALLLARLVSSTEHLPEVMVRSLHFIIGEGVAELLSNDIQANIVKIPSASTLSRTRLKLDSWLLKKHVTDY